MNRKPEELARFIDKYERERVIHKRPNGRVYVKRDKATVYAELGNAIGRLVGARLREERKRSGLTMDALAFKSGLSGTRVRIREIETGGSGGVRLGTLYALAAALNIDPVSLLPSLDLALREAGVSMVGDMRLFTRDDIARMLRAVNGPQAVAPP